MSNLKNISDEIYNVNISDSRLILSDFTAKIKNNAVILKDILKKENEYLNATYDYNKIIETLGKLEDYEYVKLAEYSSIGTIFCITDGDVYFLLDMLVKAILSKSKLIIAADRYMWETNKYLVETIKGALNRNGVTSSAVSIIDFDEYKNIGECKFIDCVVVNKDFELYKQLEEKYDIKIIYSDYGNVNIYMESDEFINMEEELVTNLRKVNKEIYLTKLDDIEKYVKNLGSTFVFNTVFVFTKDIDKCKFFLKNIKAENIFVNKTSLETNTVNISEFEFMYKKRIII